MQHAWLFREILTKPLALKKGIMVELKCSGTVKNLNMGLAIMVSLIWAFLATNSPG